MQKWKKSLSLLLSLAMLLGLCMMNVGAEGLTQQNPVEETTMEDVVPVETNGDDNIALLSDDVASIDGTPYETLAKAVEAVPTDNTETTITLLKDTVGSGIKVVSGQNIVFDLQDNEYTVNKPTVGSTGTETNGFQLLKGSKVTFKNGTVSSVTGADSLPNGGILIQNYCDLTLDNVILDTSSNSNIDYVISNNNGSLTVTKDTEIKAAEGKVAFDLWYGMNGQGLYDEGIEVTFDKDFRGTVTGKVEYGAANRAADTDWSSKAKLIIEAGNFYTELVDSNANDNVELKDFNIIINGGTFSNDPSSFVPDDYAVTYADNKYTVAKLDATNAVASIDGTPYKTLAKAVEAVPTDNTETTITLLKDTVGSGIKVVSGQNIVFDLQDNEYTVNKPTVGSTGTETNGFQLLKGSKVTFKNGTVSSVTGADSLPNGGILIQNYCDLTLDNVILDTSSNSNIDYVISNNNGSLTITKDTEIKAAEGKVAFDLWYGMNGQGLYDEGIEVTFDKDFSGTVTGKVEYGAANRAADTDWSSKTKLIIEAGNFNTELVDSNANDNVELKDFNIIINGGYFTSDPTAYKADERYVVASDKPGYVYMVTDTAPAEAVVVVEESVDATVPNDAEMSEEDKTAIENVIGMAKVNGVANALTDTAKNSVLTSAGVDNTILEDESKVVKVEVSVSVSATAATLSGDNASLEFTVKPTATVTVDGVPQGDIIDIPNSYLDGSGMEVKLPLPAGFTPVEIMHVCDSDGSHERFLTTGSKTFTIIEENGQRFAVLTITKFSTLTANGRVTVAAIIGDTEYGTLQEAVDAAPKGATITLTQDSTEAIFVSGKSLTIDCGIYTYDAEKVSVGKNCKKTVSGTLGTDQKIAITYKSNVSGGGGGGGSTVSTYNITVSDTTNGTVKTSASSAAKGTKITLTVTPSSDYELDSLIVKDASGNIVSTSKESDNTYTFTMPASKVTISASFEKITSEFVFMDVASDAYYFDAVKWAVDKGVTSGMTATTFAPENTCTRAQTVTFLWRAMGSPEPTTASNSFTDVSSDAYYYKAVLWAVEKGITVGTSDMTFAPDATVTRGQTVTFLWRAAGMPATTADNPFTDVSANDYYADAVLWAVETGVTDGTSATAFSPDVNCTRGQIVTFLYRHLGK